MEWASELLEKFGAKAGVYKQTVDKFHTQVDDLLRLYRHEEHIEFASKKSWAYLSGEIEQALSRGNHDFCYSDTHAFLQKIVKTYKDVRILTYGNGEYQRYKINLCRFLSALRIPVHVVNQPKRQFLSAHFGKIAGILIDDKYPLDLPTNWTHFWINRKGKVNHTAYTAKDNAFEITTLNQFFDVVKSNK